MAFFARVFLPVEIQFVHQLAIAQVMAVLLHHHLRHAHLELGRRRTQDAALEQVGAIQLAHDVMLIRFRIKS